MQALILAGGQATRLWPLTDQFAKPLLIVGGLPLASHIVNGIPENIDCTVSTNPEFKQDFLRWAKKYHPERKIKIFIEKVPAGQEKLGAVRAISFAVKELKIREDILVVAGDNFITFPMTDFINRFKGKTLVAAYDIKNKNEAKKFGVMILGKMNRVAEITEKPARPRSTMVSTACYLIPQKYFGAFHRIAQDFPDNLGVFLAKFLEQNIPVYGYTFSGAWYDIGSYELYLDLHKKEKAIIAKTKNVGNCRFLGSVYLGEKAKIKDSVIIDSIVLDSAIVENSTLRDSVVAENCIIKNVDLEKKVIPRNSIIEG